MDWPVDQGIRVGWCVAAIFQALICINLSEICTYMRESTGCQLLHLASTHARYLKHEREYCTASGYPFEICTYMYVRWSPYICMCVPSAETRLQSAPITVRRQWGQRHPQVANSGSIGRLNSKPSLKHGCHKRTLIPSDSSACKLTLHSIQITDYKSELCWHSTLHASKSTKPTRWSLCSVQQQSGFGIDPRL
jgi:hypothetical protein